MGGCLQGHTDKGHGDTLVLADGVGREDRGARLVVDDIGGEEVETRTGEWIAVQVAVDGVRSALLHAAQLVAAVVELVVADAVDVEADEVHGLDGGFVVEQGGDQGRCADEVSGGDEDRVLRLGAGGGDVGGQIIGAAHPTEGVGGGGDMAVEVVDGDDAELHFRWFSVWWGVCGGLG